MRPRSTNRLRQVALVWVIGSVFLTTMYAADSRETRDQRAPSSDSIVMGEIVGAEYDYERNEFVLYATEASGGDSTVLYVDDVTRMALAVLGCGAFGFSLEAEDAQDSYMHVRYLPRAKETVLKSILRSTTVEATFLYTDKVQKNLAYCEKVADDLSFPLCELDLIGAWLQNKTVREFDAGSYVTYFDLDVFYRFEYLPVVWYENPNIIVRAAVSQDSGPPEAGQVSQPPEPVQAFAQILTQTMPRLLTHRELGKEFRRLRALLLLGKTFGWARSILVPIDVHLLASYELTRVAEVSPIPIKIYHVEGRDSVLTLAGGVWVSTGFDLSVTALHNPLPRKSVDLESIGFQATSTETCTIDLSHQGARREPPGFSVEQVVKNGRRLLRINIGGILGLKRGG